MYRGMGAVTNAECRKDPFCRNYTNVACYGPGYFTDYCAQWRSGMDNPPAPKPPAGIDLTSYSVDDPAKVLTDITTGNMADWQSQMKEDMARQSDSNLLGTIGGYIPDGISNPFAGQDWSTVALVIAAVAAVSMFRG